MSEVPRNIRHVLIDARPLHRNMRTFEPGVPVVLQDGRKGTIDSKRGRTYRVKFKDGPLDKFKMIKKGRIHLSTLHTEDIKCPGELQKSQDGQTSIQGGKFARMEWEGSRA
ncbi:unnamed protein product [Prorocentrum cordatum]|uniref:50S ribosomal protein L24, chloroplastic n=1 Tax=Prorocentrum cordatum TaxID=2364126 RepID=A0ABN9T5Q4_9DINO|nr:unnamed protein product [Polarella glacialis]